MILTTLILYSIVFLALLLGSYTDLRTREVPDWVTYGLIFMGLGLRLMHSAILLDWTPIVTGLLGFGVFFIISLAMFYTGQWGGGDSKMLMGIGALVGLEMSLDSFLIGFFLNVLIFGAIYGIIYGIFLAVRNRKKFMKEAKRLYHERIRHRNIMLAVVVMMVISIFFVDDLRYQIPLFSMIILIFVMFYATLMMKAVENVCMLKMVPPEKLTEGDWIAKDVFVGKKRICGPKDLGVSIEQIKRLTRLKKQRKLKEVLIKEGIPFVPSFLIAFIATLIWGNWLLAAIF